MKKILIFSILSLFVLFFCLLVPDGAGRVQAEDIPTTTTTVAEEEPTTTVATETTALTTEGSDLSEEDIAAILAQLNMTEFVSQVWDALAAKVPWLVAVFAFFGIGTPTGLIWFVILFTKKMNRSINQNDRAFEGSAALDKDLNDNTLVQKQNLDTATETKLKVQELATVFGSIMPVLKLTAKGINLLVTSSKNENVVAQATAFGQDYIQATGDLVNALKVTSVGQDILQAAGDLKNMLAPKG
jgi:hypothetical protein